MFFFIFKKSNLSQVASNLIHQIQHTNGHLPHSEARFLYKAKKSSPPTPPFVHLIIWIFIYTLGGLFQNLLGFVPSFNKRSQRIWSNIETSTLTPRIFNIWLIPFVNDDPSTYLTKLGGEKKKKKPPKVVQIIFPKCTILPFSFFFFFSFPKLEKY